MIIGYAKTMEFIEILGLVAGICTSSSLIPQLVKTIKLRKADDVSVFMFIVMMTGNSLWIYYGIDKSDFPIIATNILALSLNIAMLVLKAKFG
jgi:MtN3 and saliva related transmembrane protein